MSEGPRLNRLFFIDQNSNNLLITIGDSWTWGDSLGDLSIRYRSDHIYGKYISEHLGSDWLNYGYCGSGNNALFLVLEYILTIVSSEFKKKSDFAISENAIKSNITLLNLLGGFLGDLTKTLFLKKYQKIYVCFTLSETGRDFNKEAKGSTVVELLNQDEILLSENFKKIEKNCSNLFLITARNFSSSFNNSLRSINLEKNWIQINFEHNYVNGFNNHGYTFNDINKTGTVSGIGFQEIEKLDHADKKQYIVDQIDSVDRLWYWLRNNPLNYNKATCHPTEESHRLWAEYLCQHLKKV